MPLLAGIPKGAVSVLMLGLRTGFCGSLTTLAAWNQARRAEVAAGGGGARRGARRAERKYSPLGKKASIRGGHRLPPISNTKQGEGVKQPSAAHTADHTSSALLWRVSPSRVCEV